MEQLDRKMRQFHESGKLPVPEKGWVNAIRTAVKMSLQQLGNRLNITPQSVHEIELREVSGSITLSSLRDVAEAMDMKLVYGFVPKDQTLEKWIERKALEAARTIVLRTSHTMMLEGQENSPERIEKAIQERATMIKYEMPKLMWNV